MGRRERRKGRRVEQNLCYPFPRKNSRKLFPHRFIMSSRLLSGLRPTITHVLMSTAVEIALFTCASEREPLRLTHLRSGLPPSLRVSFPRFRQMTMLPLFVPWFLLPVTVKRKC